MKELQARAKARVTCLIGDLHATFGRRHLAKLEMNGKNSSESTTLPTVSSSRPACPGGALDEGFHTALGCVQMTTKSFNPGTPFFSKDGSFRENILDAVATVLATGVEPVLSEGDEEKHKTVLAVQSLVPEHTVVATLLMGTTPLGKQPSPTRCTLARAGGTYPSAGA